MALEKYDYNAMKCKLRNIVDNDLFHIINDTVSITNKLIFEGNVLFNQVVLFCLKNNRQFHLDTTLIRRCVKKVLSPDDKVGRAAKVYKKQLKKKLKKKNKELTDEDKKKNEEIKKNKENIIKLKDDSLAIINEVYTNEYKIHPHSLFAKEKCITTPVESFSATFNGNITNHCGPNNFFSFQKRYIILKNSALFTGLKLTDKQLDPIVYAVQKSLHLDIALTIVTSKIDSDIIDQLIEPLEYFIKKEKNNVPAKLLVKKEKIKYIDIENNYGLKPDFRNYFSATLEHNREDVLRYYYNILKSIQPEEKKRFNGFSILPQVSLKYNHIMIDNISLSAIYNKWKIKKKPKSTEVVITDFKTDYDKYFCEMFSIKQKFGRLVKKYKIPPSFSTDGCSVSLLFKKKIPKKQKKEEDKKDIPKTKTKIDSNIKQGLFNADAISVDKEFLTNYNVIWIDPGVKYMVRGASESNKLYSHSKGEYYNTAHITMNYKKKMKLMEDHGINKINEKLAETTTHTYKTEEYMKYVNILRNNWEVLWKFYGLIEVRELAYDTYIHKKKAINEIIRKLIPKIKKDKREKKEKEFKNVKIKDPYFNVELYEKEKNKPVLIAFGNGNGKMTVNNVKNSGPKGPIKKLIEELSKICLVIMVDEYNTSQVCGLCYEEKVDYINVLEKAGKKKRQREANKKEKDEKYITTKEKIEKMEELKKQLEETMDKKKKEKHGKEIEKLKKASHGMCSCKNETHGHRIMARDYNSARNIGEVLERKLLKKPLGLFLRKKQQIKIVEEKAEKKAKKKEVSIKIKKIVKEKKSPKKPQPTRIAEDNCVKHDIINMPQILMYATKETTTKVKQEKTKQEKTKPKNERTKIASTGDLVV